MIITITNAYLQKLFEGKAVPGKPKYSSDVIAKFKKTILKLQFADSIEHIRKQHGLGFKAMRGNYRGFYSVRIDIHYRLLLTVEKTGKVEIAEVITVHELTNHYQ